MFVVCVDPRAHKSSEADYKVAAAGSAGATYRGGVARPRTPADWNYTITDMNAGAKQHRDEHTDEHLCV